MQLAKPKLIISVSAVVIICAAIIASQLRFSHFPLQWLPEDNFARVATEAVDENLKGSLTLEVIIDTEKTNGLYNPEVLRVIDDVSQNINSISTGICLLERLSAISMLLKKPTGL